MNTEITKEEYDETIHKASEIIREMQINALKRFPLWMRMNWFSVQMNKAILDKHEESEFDWAFINEICSKDLDPFDCNMYQPVDTVEQFEIQRFNIICASEGLGPWHKHTCKDCGEEFYMTYKEVHFYKDKELNLPKRCKACRDKRKVNQSK
ncbi:MAG: zinc-ribbon domain containing protein [Bacteroidales bacterium]|nr:zinc-ribbon domain containing protein [Bacteroidales bacterium]